MSDVSGVTVKQLVGICTTLSNIVCKSFGPRCKSTLLATSTGKIMITSDGIKILKSLNIGHPVGKVIVQAIESHHRHYGDGVKSFLVYLTEFLQHLSQIVPESENSVQKVSLTIPRFIDNVLLMCINCVVSVNVKCLEPSTNFSDVSELVASVIKTTLSSNLTYSQTLFFCKLVTSSLISESSNVSSILDTLDVYLQNFEYLHICCQQSHTASKLIPGIVLPDFTILCHDSTKKYVKFIILRNSIEGNTSDNACETIQILTETSLNLCLTNQVSTVNTFLCKLVDSDIQLIITNQKVPLFVIALCKKYGISVIGYLDDEVIQFLETLFRLSALSSVFHEIDLCSIGETTCDRIKLNGRYHANLNISETPALKTFILCAPTDGLNFELSTLIFKSMKTLDSTSNRHKKHLQYQSVKNMTVVTVSIVKNTDFEQNVEQTSNTHSEAESTSQTSEDINKLSVIPGGGLFEFQLAKAIKKTSDNFNMSEYGLISKLTYEMLLGVPRILHTNTCATASTKQRNFVKILQQIMDSENSLCLSAKGEVCDASTSCNVLESLHLKVATLFNVFQLLQQLLRLNMILGIK